MKKIISTISSNLKTGIGIKQLTDYYPVDERKWLYDQTTITELCFEEYNEVKYVRLRFRTYKGKGYQGSSTKSFAWPVMNCSEPIELTQLSDLIVNSINPTSMINDNRGFFRRWIDRLSGARFINHLPYLAEHHNFAQVHHLSATIYEEKLIKVVNLSHHVKGGSFITVQLPIDVVIALGKWQRYLTKKSIE